MKEIQLFLLLFLYSQLFAQSYTSYFTGDTANVSTPTKGGICLMGGATENDSAMVWFLKQSGGGDIVVIRATGSNGYNDYLYAQLGVNVNSVETLVIPNLAAANDPYVLKQIHNAEAIWIAGGDQYNYVQFWKNSPIKAELNQLIVNHVPLGGTSAGMAIQGQAYFDAANGSATSNTALSNPYNSLVSLGYNDFLQHKYLKNVITDTHYDNPIRNGRHLTFLARLVQQENQRFYGIACEEYTAVCIDSTGNARIFGSYPTYDDFAYFLVTNCQSGSFGPEICSAGTPLTWNRNGAAVLTYKVGGTSTGSNTFNLNDWKTGSGGNWENWSAVTGSFISTPNGQMPNCFVTNIQHQHFSEWNLYPNPANDFVQMEFSFSEGIVSLWDLQGKKLREIPITSEKMEIEVSDLTAGIYFVKVYKGEYSQIKKLVLINN